jgi:hypothetical protein
VEDRLERAFDQMWDEFREVRRELAVRKRWLVWAGWALVGILVVQVIAAVVALS